MSLTFRYFTCLLDKGHIKSGGGFCILWWGWCIHCKNGADGGLTHERLYRGAGGGSWELYYLNKSDGATDSEEIWNIEIYGT